MFNINFTTAALDDLREIKKFDQRRVIDEIESQLAHQPDQPSRNRKHLRPNQLAEWELRVGEFRVFYDVLSADMSVSVVAIGQKIGNRLIVHGEDYEL